MQRRQYSLTPGTVSNILWHFTGGPIWDSARKRQSNTAKPADDAYANLKNILKTQELRLGSFKEVIHVTPLPLPVRNKKTGKTTVVNRDPFDVESSPVCCLADIPAPHLSYHAHRYGKFAIGFHRNAVVRAGFNPVFYTLHDAPHIRSIYRGFAALNRASVDAIRKAVEHAHLELSDLEDDKNDTSGVWHELNDIKDEAEVIDTRLLTTRKSLANFVAFVKTFDKKEFNSIYCEREWRSIQPLHFNVDDIAMVVLPRKIGAIQYFHRFVGKSKIGRSLPRRVPIVAWEDLVES